MAFRDNISSSGFKQIRIFRENEGRKLKSSESFAEIDARPHALVCLKQQGGFAEEEPKGQSQA